MRPSIDGAMGEGWKGLHTGWGYRKPVFGNGNGGKQVQRLPGGRDYGWDSRGGGFNPFKSNGNGKRQAPLVMKSLANGGTGNGKPVLVHKGEVIISNPFGRRGGRRP